MIRDPEDCGLSDEEFQEMARLGAQVVRQVLDQLFMAQAVRFEGRPDAVTEAAALISGGLDGLLQFAMDGGHPEEDPQMRAHLIEIIDECMPQIRMDLTMAGAGAVGAGHA